MEILGVQVDNITMEEATLRVEEMIADGKKHFIVTPNPEFLVDAYNDPEFRKILNKADLSLPDGAGLVLASWALGKPLPERVSGTDFVEKICEKAAKKSWGVFFLGAQPGLADRASELLAARYPELRVLGCYAGNAQAAFDKETRSRVEGKIKEKRIDLLFVAFGHKKQEKWIERNFPHLKVSVAIGVGGAFDFISGKVKRAPGWVRKIGLEWFWRLLLEPWRAKRIFKAVVVFPGLVVKELVRKRVSVYET